MGTTNNSFWLRIQQGLRDTEKLMSQQQYNMSMIKARQTLEYMVNFLGERALIVEGDLADSIDQLFEGRFISQSTKDHYHRIRVLGNKAVHEGDDSPYDAGEACQLLTQEVHAFANSLNNGKHHSDPVRQQPEAVKTVSVTSRNNGTRNGAPVNEVQRTGAPGSSTRAASARAGARPAGSRNGGAGSGSARSGQRPSQRTTARSGQKPSSRSRSRRRSKKKGFDTYGLLKPALIFLVLLVIVLVIIKLIPGKDDKKETTVPETTAEITTEAMTTTAAETLPPETETEAPKIYTAKSKLNVRSEPSASGTKLGSLASGTVVDFVEAYDDKWTVIMFEGKQAYVATEFLTVSEGKAENDETGTTGAAESSKTANQ